MMWRVELRVVDGSFAGTRAALRYDVLERMAACTRARGVEVIAFGLGDRALRLVLHGEPAAVRSAMHGLRCGTARKLRNDRLCIAVDAPITSPVAPGALRDAVGWAHEAVSGEPLASPWCSARDLEGFRHARFFDADAAHRRLNAEPRQPPPAPAEPARLTNLSTLMRLAAAVLGVLPADRTCFRLFVHLGRRMGFRAEDLADALSLSARRVRQLLHEREPHLGVALISLGDERLAVVP